VEVGNEAIVLARYYLLGPGPVVECR
jgi:hypothetical protein